MNEKPTHLDLFSGIGGFSLAFEAAGFRTIGFAEIEPYASAVLRKHWPDVPNFGDVRTITTDTIGSVDVVTGGFPCQPFSVAGKRGGDSDERFLWPECVRILRELQPRFALFENVPGLLSIDRGRTFNRVLSDISALGYDCLWNCVPASAVGANHQRDRVWIVANSSLHKLCDAQGEQCRDKKKHEPGKRGTLLANPQLPRPERRGGGSSVPAGGSGGASSNIGAGCPYLADAISERGRSGNGERENAIHADSCSKAFGTISNKEWWATEPNVGRVVNGIPNRTHRLKGLGNAIVPQVAFIFAQAIYNRFKP